MLVDLRVSSLFSVEGKTALVTGAAGFLGRTLTEALLVNGAKVIALGRSDRTIRQAERWASEYGKERIRCHQIDMYELREFAILLDRILDEEGRIDVLVNNAHELSSLTGFNVPEGSIEHSSYDQWLRNFTGAVYWPALTVQKLGPAMKARGRGSIINISTMYATVAPSPHLYAGTKFLNPPGYSASKAGLLSFTRYIASFWGPYGIRANAILPGPFSNTIDSGPNAVNAADEFLERLRRRTCLNRIGLPHELPGALLFLASDASSFVTGQALVVDGGWTVT